MSNVSNVWNDADLGYTGTGMTIAILDTGLDMDYPSFAADPELNEYSWTVEYLESSIYTIYEVDPQTGALTALAYPMTADGYEVSNVYAIAADADGVVYIYSTYDDYISSIDLETGIATHLNSLSRLSVYGGSDGEPMAMVYDPITLDIYLLMTQNGNYYRMFSFDTTTYALAVMVICRKRAYRA